MSAKQPSTSRPKRADILERLREAREARDIARKELGRDGAYDSDVRDHLAELEAAVVHIERELADFAAAANRVDRTVRADRAKKHDVERRDAAVRQVWQRAQLCIDVTTQIDAKVNELFALARDFYNAHTSAVALVMPLIASRSQRDGFALGTTLLSPDELDQSLRAIMGAFRGQRLGRYRLSDLVHQRAHGFVSRAEHAILATIEEEENGASQRDEAPQVDAYSEMRRRHAAHPT